MWYHFLGCDLIKVSNVAEIHSFKRTFLTWGGYECYLITKHLCPFSEFNIPSFNCHRIKVRTRTSIIYIQPFYRAHHIRVLIDKWLCYVWIFFNLASCFHFIWTRTINSSLPGLKERTTNSWFHWPLPSRTSSIVAYASGDMIHKLFLPKFWPIYQDDYNWYREVMNYEKLLEQWSIIYAKA